MCWLVPLSIVKKLQFYNGAPHATDAGQNSYDFSRLQTSLPLKLKKIGNSRLFSNILQHLPQSLLQIQRVLLASRLPSPCFQGFRFHTVGLGEPWRGFATKRLAVLFV